MSILEVYQQYEIMPNLQEHMLRVAGVALLICEHLQTYARSIKSDVSSGINESILTSSKTSDAHSIITACLLHDMGNILKFNLDVFPDFLQPQGREYWQQVQEMYKQRYGQTEHHATLAIAQELGASDRVLELIRAVGFQCALQNMESSDLGKKICAYADMRVSPHGVVTLLERCQDLEKRYHSRYSSPQDVERRQEFVRALQQIEQQIFNQISSNKENAAFRPADITEEAVQTKIELLQQWTI